MGGRPLTALAIAAFPQDGLHTDDIAQIFRGGFDKLREAGVALLGGHTVQDREIKFGYAVTGAVDPKRILTNAGAKAGDRLILTKPLGTGIVGTAIKFGRAPSDVDRSRGRRQMRTLNKAAAEAIADTSTACTRAPTSPASAWPATRPKWRPASHVTIAIDATALPIIPGVLEIASQNKSGGMATNREHFAAGHRIWPGVSDELRDLVFDPQTSGGLFLSVADRGGRSGHGKRCKKAGIQAVFRRDPSNCRRHGRTRQ